MFNKRVLLFSLLLSATLFASQVAVNSRDWQDVYSSVLYAKVTGADSRFMISSSHSTIFHKFLNSSEELIYVEGVQSFSPNYASTLENNGFIDIDEIKLSGVELAFELAGRAGCKDFVVVGDTYGYNAISVASYASTTNSFVFLANSDNVEQIASFFDSNAPNSIILFGAVEEKVSETLSRFDVEIIDEGNRFENNLEIVKRFLSVSPSKQAMFSTGEFIEDGLMGPDYPLILIGSATPPQSVFDYLQESELTIGVVVGNELVTSAKTVKDRTPIESMFVKYA